MKNHWNTEKMPFAIMGVGFSYFMGGCDGLLIVSAMFVVANCITGIMHAANGQGLSGKTGFDGICRKAMIFVPAEGGKHPRCRKGW